MDKRNLAVPMFGKMATRSFHSNNFKRALDQGGVSPLYFVPQRYLEATGLEQEGYFALDTDRYDQIYKQRSLLRKLTELRRYTVKTETTDLRFRESLEGLLFGQNSATSFWIYAAYMDILRHLPGLGHLATAYERLFCRTNVHSEVLKSHNVQGVLVPGIGNYGFRNEGLFAREAKQLGIPVLATITNYDNLMNKGYRGFTPDCLVVWSHLMANDAIKLQGIPAHKIEISGPPQFDCYFASPAVSREAFLLQRGLRPSRKTILFAGGVNITRYFEIYDLLLSPKSRAISDCNVVIRPYPHPKLLSSPGWKLLEDLCKQIEGVYISNPLNTSFDDLVSMDVKRDLDTDLDQEELHGLLKYSDVIVNIYSTISLEAAICDLPTIHLGYDEYTFGHQYRVLTVFQQRQTHNRRKARLAASRIATDRSELLKYIEHYLTDRMSDREARYEYARLECEYMDGKSSERLASCIGKFIKGNFSEPIKCNPAPPRKPDPHGITSKKPAAASR